jgi:Flp pilus assembly protein TadD
MKRPALAPIVLPALLSLLACARPLARVPLSAGVAAACDERWDEAVRFWKTALEQDPDSAAAHNNLAVAMEKQGAWEEAGREYDEALRLDPANAEIRANYESFKSRLEAGRKKAP